MSFHRTPESVSQLSDQDLLSKLVGHHVTQRPSSLAALCGLSPHVKTNEPIDTPMQFTLDCARELFARALRESLSENKASLTSPETVKTFLQMRLSGKSAEVFCVLFLDAMHRLIAFEEMFRGTLSQTSVYPREVVKRAFELNAQAVILCHNHPSGSVQPSRADEALTQTLKSALSLVDVSVIDHMIVGNGQVLSMAQSGLI